MCDGVNSWIDCDGSLDGMRRKNGEKFDGNAVRI